MAVAPLFVADMDTLKARLRLSGVPANSNAAAMVDQATEEVRVNFYERLGVARVAQLVAIPYAQNPTTTDGIMRARANSTEIAGTRLHLLDRMPLLYVDGSVKINQDWNDEAPFRAINSLNREQELERSRNEFERMLAILVGFEDAEVRVLASAIGPDPKDVSKPGFSVFPWRRAEPIAAEGIALLGLSEWPPNWPIF